MLKPDKFNPSSDFQGGFILKYWEILVRFKIQKKLKLENMKLVPIFFLKCNLSVGTLLESYLFKVI